MALFSSAVSAHAATTVDAPAWVLKPEVARDGAVWTESWRYQPGDNPAWAAADFDDGAWPIGLSADVPRHWQNGTWKGIGWFRLRLDARELTAPALMLLVLTQSGASDVFLDGVRIGNVGQVAADYQREVAVRRAEPPLGATLTPGRLHVLAIRHSNHSGFALSRIDPRLGGFQLWLAPPTAWTQNALEAARNRSGSMMFFLAVPLLLAAIHIALFIFLPRTRESLYCALFMCALSGLTFTRLKLDEALTVVGYLIAHRFFLMSIVAFSLLCLLTIYTTFGRPKGKFFISLALVGGVLLIWTLFAESQLMFRLCAAFGFVVSAEAIRVTALAVRAGRDGAALVLGGMVLFGIAVLYNSLRIFGIVDEYSFSTHSMNFGILAAALGMSFFISRNYAITTKRLERKLVEVEELSAQNLAHEREKQAIAAAQNEILERQVQERTAELRTERDKSDELLANILPQEVIAELKATGASTPRRCEEVTILFSDFNGFTSTVSAIPAHRLIRELNDIFKLFDEITDREGLEKIKTIGDAYMAAGGLLKPQPDHAHRCVRAALAMQESIARRNEIAAIKWRMRVGLHVGPVVAGVVGKRKFTFDVFGDTVNLASRMESSAEPGHINVSAYTYDLIRDEFDCEYRGKLEFKGKGQLDLYTVRGAKVRT